ncbi:ABC transporter permease [Clostridium sp. 19966]|uniref:ABC transporter permease n=1 Tax=Clostridium sp. 19966 TaxID=2768166 RepID=UPI0028DDC9CF|nr:ABC transporter permease [Clostridium sp. 19966]MDT8718908.1 ABC transporter permease [Clostridium sp. 19966]
MKIIDIALKDLKVTLKDKRTILLLVIMPLTLIFVLGMALSSMFNKDSAGIKAFDVALVDEDGGSYAKQFKDFLNSNDIKKIINLKNISYDTALGKVKKGEIPVLIKIPKGYSEGLNTGKKENLEIYKDPGDDLDGKIVESLVASYTKAASSITSGVKAAYPVFKTQGMDSSMLIPTLLKSLDSADSNFKESSVSSDSLSAMQYYSAAMLVMYILFVAMMGTSSIIEEREQKTLLRLMGSTAKRSTIITGKILGLFMIGVFEVLVIILFTKFVFNVNWGNSIIAIALISAAMLIASCGIAMTIATLFKTNRAVEAFSSPFVMIISFIGGSMFPIYTMPDTMQKISKIAPNNWALRGYIDVMQGGTAASSMNSVLVLTAIGIVLLAFGTIKLKLN